MFKTLKRKLLPNPLDRTLRSAAKRGASHVLLCWNRGLGDIALGVAAVVHRIRHFLNDAKISILTRENLRDGFSMLEGVDVLVDPTWKRGEPAAISIDVGAFDLVLQNVSPTDWCRWQLKRFTPRLRWEAAHDTLAESFGLPKEFTYIGIQVEAETNYGLWRNPPEKRIVELLDRIHEKGGVRALLFGSNADSRFAHPAAIDLRGKTTLFELLSIIKNHCTALVLPDSGILSMVYYLDTSFPIRVVSLWADPNHGVLKQGVASPNRLLTHVPLIGSSRNLSSVSAESITKALFPKRTHAPLRSCTQHDEVVVTNCERAACAILAGGIGSRLGFPGPKGLFPVAGKPLFQHLLEKVSLEVPVVVMTSRRNTQETTDYFCMAGRDARCFEQEEIALLDEAYQPAGMASNGNGSFYASIVRTGVLDALEAQGVDAILVSAVDNPLADPADKALLAFHRQMGAEVTIKCVERIPGESMGALSETGVVEYFDIEEDCFSFSYVGQAVLSTAFIRKAASLPLPYHWVKKQGLWKRERLLFDAFPEAKRTATLCYPRASCYKPIKQREDALS